ncbi:hypothetical protein TNCV_1277401 [Trichonephila clavipes]|nr:hypothetical protein TNCV_1277401 [Trichonephila clavipes]
MDRFPLTIKLRPICWVPTTKRRVKLNFNAMDKDTENYARNLVHGCRSSEHGIPIFKEFFTMQELNMALSNLDPSKSPGLTIFMAR